MGRLGLTIFGFGEQEKSLVLSNLRICEISIFSNGEHAGVLTVLIVKCL